MRKDKELFKLRELEKRAKRRGWDHLHGVNPKNATEVRECQIKTVKAYEYAKNKQKSDSELAYAQQAFDEYSNECLHIN